MRVAIQPVSFFSGALFARKTCYVYLPPSYGDSEDRRYPVVYFLHGLHGSETDWVLRGNAEATFDRMIAQGDIRECIAVMPNDGGYGLGTFYLDWYDGTGNFGQYITDDLVPFIDASFRTVADSGGRFIGGFSMGGIGAFLLALRNPHLFGAAASISGALISVSNIPYKEFSRMEWARMIGPRNGGHAKRHDIALLAAERRQEGNMPDLYFNCGTEDDLFEVNTLYKQHLERIGYPHHFVALSGEHKWEFCAERLPDVLNHWEHLLREREVAAR